MHVSRGVYIKGIKMDPRISCIPLEFISRFHGVLPLVLFDIELILGRIHGSQTFWAILHVCKEFLFYKHISFQLWSRCSRDAEAQITNLQIPGEDSCCIGRAKPINQERIYYVWFYTFPGDGENRMCFLISGAAFVVEAGGRVMWSEQFSSEGYWLKCYMLVVAFLILIYSTPAAPLSCPPEISSKWVLLGCHKKGGRRWLLDGRKGIFAEF